MATKKKMNHPDAKQDKKMIKQEVKKVMKPMKKGKC
jgi:hypothetical protein